MEKEFTIKLGRAEKSQGFVDVPLQISILCGYPQRLYCYQQSRENDGRHLVRGWVKYPLLHGLANFVPFNSRTLFPECLFTNRGILDFSTVKLPTVKLPTVKMPTVKLPTVKMPRLVNY